MGIRFQGKKKDADTAGVQDLSSRSFAVVCLISLFAHAVFFSGIIWFYNVEFHPAKPRVVRVDLVSFAPGPEPGKSLPASVETAKDPIPDPEPEPVKEPVPIKAEPKTAPAVAPAPEPDPSPELVRVLKPEVSLKPKPKDLKKITDDRKKEEKQPKPSPTQPRKTPEKKLERATRDLAEPVDTQNGEQIAQALKRLQKTVKGQGRGLKKGPGVGAGQGSDDPGPLELYKLVIASTISQHWVFNEAMAGMNQNLEVKVFVKILKSGEIRDISYETRSGNVYLDESAKKAIRRANPLPELPGRMTSFEVVLGFTPRGLK